jgi:spermidine/putrescine transport system permease protein
MNARRLLALPAALAFLLIYAPLVAVVLFSFNESPVPVMPLQGVTTEWYTAAFDDDAMLEALSNTLEIGALVVVLCLVLATAGALAVRHRSFPGRGLYEFVIGMPFLLPEVVTGVALLGFFAEVDVALSKTTIVIGHVLFCVGASFRLIAARLEALPASLEEAARDLGRGPLGTFWTVTLPGLRSALVAAAVLVFALSFDQTVITIFLTGTDNTLPTFLWAQLRLGFSSELNAIATLILLATTLLVLPLALRGREAERAL